MDLSKLLDVGQIDCCRRIGREEANRVSMIGLAELDSLCATAAFGRQAFDVMMRKHWNTQELDGRWVVFGRMCPLEVHEWSMSQKHADPFTAIVEADRWYADHVSVCVDCGGVGYLPIERLRDGPRCVRGAGCLRCRTTGKIVKEDDR